MACKVSHPQLGANTPFKQSLRLFACWRQSEAGSRRSASRQPQAQLRRHLAKFLLHQIRRSDMQLAALTAQYRQLSETVRLAASLGGGW